MTADLVELVDSVTTDLLANVSGFAGLADPAQVHRYVPWNPAELQPDGRRHLAVWPASDENDQSEPLEMDGQYLNQLLSVLVWEGSEEGPRRAPDDAGARALLQVWNDARARFYLQARQTLVMPSGLIYDRVWYRGTFFPEAPAMVRWFRIYVTARRVITFV